MRFLLSATAVVLLGLTAVTQQSTPLYKSPSAPIDERVKDLMGRMTLEEKAAQLQSTWQNRTSSMPPSQFFMDANGKLDVAKAKEILKNGLGQLSRPSEALAGVNHNPAPPEAMAEFTNQLQKIMLEDTHLGIPLMFHEECLHGLATTKGTSYPQAIALAGTWDPALLREIFTATALEVRTRGVQECLMPVVDLARDPRWGRTEETYGEDPYLVSRMGNAAVLGLQGVGPSADADHVYATLKHFAVHSQPEGGTNVGPAPYAERTIRESFLVPFETGIKQAHASTIMPSYNELDGIPNHSNVWLLRDVLRKEWGFNGLVVSDYFAIDEMITKHHIAADCTQAAKYAIEAGVDIELPFGKCYAELPALVKSGQIPESLVNEAVARVLKAKFELGLFDHPYVDPKRAQEVSNNAEHQQLALRAAHEAITLLKNQNNVLPLDLSKMKRIAVIGPNAADVHLGGYSGQPGRGVSILQGIKNKVGAKGEVLYAEGCRITESMPDWNADAVVPADPEKDQARMVEAVATLQKADLGVVVVGENEQTVREAWAPNHLGDRDSLDLLGRQDELVKQLLATGKPVVVVLIHGRPNSVNFIAQNVPAILDGWYLGQEGGTALADVLFGDYNPAGRLPITVPRSVGQLPAYYYSKPTAKRGYIFSDTSPLLPFGFGLSYTTFHYANMRVTPSSMGASATATVSVDVTNTGKRAGDEVVQMYIRDEVSSVTRPVKELRGFERITLKPGETKSVTFKLGPQELQFYNRQMKRVVEPGKIRVMVGPNSVDLQNATLEVTP
ncbi:MAG TPA: glycoside hydrolase family 3 N-terminal domain-containing protein [Candidatus Binatia bacterium]|nr:glycoside hydrolase family 3 N-terminal domain-containing protein [Candidatus Binatia bacterium]